MLTLNKMADLNKINEIGEVQAQLDADASTTETLKQQEFTRVDLDTHASTVDVADQDLFTSIAAARAEVDLFLAINPGEAEIRGLINNIEAAIGGPVNSEEGIWLAEQLGIADELGLVAGSAAEAPAAESEISPERQEELRAVVDHYLEKTREVFEAAGTPIPQEVTEEAMNALKEGVENPEIRAIIEQMEDLQPNMEWVESQSDVATALMGNSNFVRNLSDGNLAAVDTLLTTLESDLEGVTDEAERAEIITEALATVPAPTTPDAASTAIENGDRAALLNSVPESMQTMFAAEFEAWEAEMLQPDATLISFNDYLIREAAGDEGKLRTIALKMQLASIIELIKPFLDMLKSLQGNTDAADEGPSDEETRAEQERDLAIRAADNGVSVEVQRQNETIAAIARYFNAPGAPKIAEFCDLEASPIVYNEAKTRAFLARDENANFKLEDVQATEATIKGLASEQMSSAILSKGLSLNELNAIALLPEGAITATNESGITIGDVLVPYGDNFTETLENVVEAFNEDREEEARQATAEAQAEAALATQIEAGEVNVDGIHIKAAAGETITPELVAQAKALLAQHPKAAGVFDKGLSVQTIQNFVNVLGNPQAVEGEWIILRDNDVYLDSEWGDARHSYPYGELTNEFVNNLFTQKLAEIHEEIND